MEKNSMKRSRGNKFWCLWQASNEINYPNNRLGWNDTLYRRLYSTIKKTRTGLIDPERKSKRGLFSNTSSSHSLSSYSSPLTLNSSSSSSLSSSVTTNSSSNSHGGIFNLSFTPDGSLLLAATEGKAILAYDPFTHQLVKTVPNAHDAALNYIKFLDDRLFATCSDDCTIALWDLRNLSSKLRTLRGHAYWVKNVEYDTRTRTLLSSGYDGCIYMWDINKYDSTSFDHGPNGNPIHFTKPLFLSCLMRMRLTHDSSKMIICTSEGYIMVIHDLKLEKLEKDLSGFQSDLYRLMQKRHSCGFDFGSWFNPLFSARRNRIELISDFPPNNESHSIFSLDVHPHNWSIISRNISRDENSEWTCVHDIQGDKWPYETVPIDVPKQGIFVSHPSSRVTIMSTNLTSDINESASSGSNTRNIAQTLNSRITSNAVQSSPTATSSSLSSTSNTSSSTTATTTTTINNTSSSTSFTSSVSDLHVSPVVIISARTLNRRAHATILAPNASYRQIEPGTPDPPRIYRNLDRLTHYREELNVGPGFIKELCFSPDGRIICSPYECGIRFLSFNQDCSEMSSAISDNPQPLHELKVIVHHSNLVVTTKFSPNNFMLASGCLEGNVNFYQPAL